MLKEMAVMRRKKNNDGDSLDDEDDNDDMERGKDKSTKWEKGVQGQEKKNERARTERLER